MIEKLPSLDQFFDLNHVKVSEFLQEQQPIWLALINLQSYLSTQRLGTILVEIPPNATLVNPELISIGEGTIVEPNAYIRGPTIIGKNCHIRHASYIRGNVIIGDNCVIGHASELKHSILLNFVKAAHFAFIGDSIVGSHVNIGAGVRCANLRLDNRLVSLSYKGEKIATTLRKFGSIIGDRVAIGCNAVINPGTLLAKGAQCYPSVNLSGFVEENTVVSLHQKLSRHIFKRGE